MQHMLVVVMQHMLVVVMQHMLVVRVFREYHKLRCYDPKLLENRFPAAEQTEIL
jgi:hypothetical protein